jgi:hypothetical protein
VGKQIAGSVKPRKAKKRKKHGPGWVAPKTMMAGIREQLVPAALALGWVPMERRPGRKDQRRFGEFEFKRVRPSQVEHMGFDFQYGDKPDVWLCLALWTGEDGVCTLFQSGNCWNYSEHMKPLWRDLLDMLKPKPRPEDPLAHALNKGLQRLQIAEALFNEGARHPDLHLIARRPPYRWPEDYGDVPK